MRWFSYFATSFHYGDTPPSFPQSPKSLPARLWLVYFKPRQESKTKWASWKHFDFKEFAEGQQSRDVLKVKYSHYEFYCKHVYSETSFCWQCLKQNKGSCKIYNYHFVLSWVIFLELFFFPPFLSCSVKTWGMFVLFIKAWANTTSYLEISELPSIMHSFPTFLHFCLSILYSLFWLARLA